MSQAALYADKERGRYPVWQSLDHPKFIPGCGILFGTVTVSTLEWASWGTLIVLFIGRVLSSYRSSSQGTSFIRGPFGPLVHVSQRDNPRAP